MTKAGATTSVIISEDGKTQEHGITKNTTTAYCRALKQAELKEEFGGYIDELKANITTRDSLI